MSLDDLLVELSTKGVKMWAENDQLRLRAPKGVLSPELQESLSERKAEILDLLSRQRAAERSDAIRLEPMPRDRGADLSFMQERLWFLAQMYPQSAVYNLPNGRRMRGPLDVHALRSALATIVKRHEVLRTTFEDGNGTTLQIVSSSPELDIETVDLSSRAEPETEATRIALAESERPFDLANGPLLRIKLLKLDNDDHLFFWCLHHIISDGWSSMVFLRELKALYEEETTGLPANLSELPIQFGDFAIWERKWLQGEVLESQLSYWRQKLGGRLPILELPSDHPRPPMLSYRGRCHPLAFSGALVGKLRSLARTTETTLFMVLLTALKVLLHRHTAATDICVGTPVARRNRPEVQDAIGCFINTLALRTDLAGEPRLVDLLLRVRDTCTEAFGRQDVPFEQLVDALQPDRDVSHTPIFQVMLILHVQDTRKVSKLGNVEITATEYHAPTSKFDLTLELKETRDGLEGWFEYSTDLFEESTVGRMAAQLETLLESIVAEPERRIHELEVLPEEERRRLLVEWNQTAADYPRESTVHALFSEQAQREPDKTAVVFGEDTLSYRELDERSSQLARHLATLHVGEQTPIGLYLERSLEMAVALLGVLKAGAAYVPLDPSFPKQRLAFMVQDANVAVILTQAALVEDMPEHQATVVRLDADWETIAQQKTSAVNSPARPDSLAYVIYTSGSTGRPKGVQIEHRSLTNFLCSMQREPGLLPEDRLLAVTTLSFDIAGLELYLPWITGATVIVASRDEASDGRVLAELIDSSNATVMQATPATWRMLVDSGWKGETALKVLCGGEALPRELGDELLQRCQSLWNVYGPTETTIWSTCERIEPGSGPVLVGRPIGNTTVYLLDEHQHPVPTGVPGELTIGGDGVARGYLGRDQLTRERFVTDTFADVEGARLYRTGDLARYRADGRLEVLGRLDHQVKLRGFRIELGEIESVLDAHPQIRQAVVVAREDTPGDKRLVAYLLAETQTAPPVAELREHLKAQLPDYMVPAAFVELEEFPLTPNGKVDRKALPAPEQNRDELDANFVAPTTPVEQQLVDIWKDVLGVERVGIHDSFFELGGHSLMAARVVSRVHDAFEADLPLLRFFEKPTVAGLASEINDRAIVAQPIPRRRQTGPARLSFAQKRLWFLDKFEEDSSAYHIPMVLRLKGELDISVLEATLSDISSRHEALRTVFPQTSGEPTQNIIPSEPVSLPLHDLSEISADESRAIRASVEDLAIQEARRSFDLSREVAHFGLVRLSADEHWLLVTFHHIVADNWSLGVFQQELVEAYAARSRGERPTLPELPVQYSDFAEWQLETLPGDALAGQLAYWREKLESATVLLDLPTDRPRPAMQSYRGSTYNMVLPTSLHRSMEVLAKSSNATLFMVLLAALNVLLSRYAGQQDISVGAPIAGRTRTELEKLIGVFINTLVLRSDLSGEPTFLELLRRVRETALGAFANQDVPFEQLVEELSPTRTLSHSPLFQVMLVLQNAPTPMQMPGGLEVERTFLDIGTAMFDLTFFVYERDDGLGVAIEYSTDLFEESTVGRMASQLETLLESIVAEPERRIHELELLPEEERRRLLVEWNQTAADYPRESTVHALFSEQAKREPDKTAVVFGEDTLSYRELDERSSQLARHLATLHVGEQTPIGLYLERSLEMAVALLGVLKAGAAYVPLDPSFPKQRLAFMVQDANVAVILTQAALVEDMPEHQATVVRLDADWETIAQQKTSALNSPARPDSLAYVIYTSGSTGRPKGVQIEHRSLTNFLCSMQREPGLLPEDRLLAVTTLSFDIAGLELYLPWITGATVIVASRDEASDGRVLAELIDSSNATVMQATPATWRMLVDSGWKGETALKVLCGGEALPRELGDELLQRCQSLWNVYGPTETTIWSTCERIEPGSGPVLVGRPIGNTTVYLLDEHQHPVPTGVAGELTIGGDGVARGYLGRDQLTRERFVTDTFADVEGARLYRTGDLARYRADGRLEVLGRLDHQVKLRGFRIELGEIESVLDAHPQIRQAVVVAREDTPGDKRLVAYLLAETQTAPPVAELREHLKAQLPDYMVPAAFVELEEFPLTPNGKVDRKALPAPEQNRDELDANFVAPTTPVEQQLVDIWKDVLGVERVGIHDSFFDLGGHSLMAVRLFTEVERHQGVRLPLATLFQATTIGELANLLQSPEKDEKPTWTCLVPIQKGGTRPPLFCIHAEGGEVLFYRDFARLLGSDQPVYGIQALGLDGSRPPLESIEEMARHYVNEIRILQPEGPYYLAGHCYGGVIVFEMAQQLKRAGHDVAFLGMLDGSPARINQTFKHKLRYGAQALLRNPVGLARHMVQAEIIARLRWKHEENRVRTNGNDAAVSEAHQRVGAALDRAYMSYAPKPYPGRITFFMNSERASIGHLKWRELATDGVDLHVFPGTPNTTFVSPSLESLADEVASCLRAVWQARVPTQPNGGTESLAVAERKG